MNLLLNFWTSNSGGSIDSQRNLIKAIINSPPHGFKKIFIVSNHLHGIKLPVHVHSINIPKPTNTFVKIKFYFKDLNTIIKNNKIDCLINFGDIPARVLCKQIFYFDWPYVVYSDKRIWKKFEVLERFKKNLKRLLFLTFKSVPDRFICQTETMRKRLELILPNKPIHKVGVGYDLDEILKLRCKRKEPEDIVFFYPTANYPFKNLSVLIDTVSICKNRHIKFSIVLTIDTLECMASKRFKRMVENMNLDEYFVFKNRVPRNEIFNIYSKSSAVLMPTLMETFGHPFLEARLLNIPMLASDLDFAHELCAPGTIFFDPFDPLDIANKICNFIGQGEDYDNIKGYKFSQGYESITWIEVWEQLAQIAIKT